MVVFYREGEKVGHLARAVPHNPACDQVSQSDSWWRVEGYFCDLEEDRMVELIDCPECLSQLQNN